MSIGQHLASMAGILQAREAAKKKANSELAARDKYLGNPGGVSRHVADLSARMLPPGTETNKSEFGGEAPHMAIDQAFSAKHPMRGVGQQTVDILRRFEGKKLPSGMTGQKLTNKVFREVVKRRLPEAYAYNIKQETTPLGKPIGALPGYDKFKEYFEQQHAEGRDWGAIGHGVTPSGLAKNAAILGGMNVAAQAIGKTVPKLAGLAGRGLFALPPIGQAGFATKLGGLALISLAEFAAADAAFEGVGQSKWAQAREDEPAKVMAAQFLAAGAGVVGVSKGAKLLRKSAITKTVQEQSRELVAYKPTAENLSGLNQANRQHARAAYNFKGYTDEQYKAYRDSFYKDTYGGGKGPMGPFIKQLPENTGPKGGSGGGGGAVIEPEWKVLQDSIVGPAPKMELPAPVEKTFGSSMTARQRVALRRFYEANPGANRAMIALGDNMPRLPEDKIAAIHRYFANHPASKRLPYTVLGKEEKNLADTINETLRSSVGIKPGGYTEPWLKAMKSLDESGLDEINRLIEAGVAPEIGVVQTAIKSNLRKSRKTVAKEAKRDSAIVAERTKKLKSAEKATPAVEAGSESFTGTETKELLKGAEVPALSKRGKAIKEKVDEAYPLVDAAYLSDDIPGSVATEEAKALEKIEQKADRLEMFKSLAEKREAVSPRTTAMSRVYQKGAREAEIEQFARMLTEDPIAAADAAARNKILKSMILVSGASMAAALGVGVTPEDAEAGWFDKVLYAGAEQVVAGAKAQGKTGEALIKELNNSKYTGKKGTVFGKIERFMDGFDSNPTVNDLKQSVSNIPEVARRYVMTPAATASLFYREGKNPFVELASRITAAFNNMDLHRQTVKEILTLVPEYTGDAKAVRKAMKPLIEKWEGKQAIASYHKEMVGKLRSARKAIKKKEDPAAWQSMTEEIEKAEGILKKSMAELKPFKGEWEATVKELAGKYSGTRMSLALEDTADFKHYPWLKNMLSSDEQAAVNALKDLNKDTGARILEAGGNLRTDRPFAHYAIHPDSNYKELLKELSPYTSNVNDALSLSRLHSRAIGSKMMMPDIEYMYANYIPDVERRMQFMKFWKKGKEGGWDQHVKDLKKYGMMTPELDSFWKHAKKIGDIDPPSKAAEWSRRYYSLEVAWRLFLSPSVGFKHLLKQTANVAIFPAKVWATGAGKAPKPLIEARVAMLREKWPKVFGDLKITRTEESKLLQAYTHQGDYTNAIAELDMFDAPASVFDKWMMSFNKHGSAIVAATEAFDRGATVLMATEMAARKGMTTSQATYAIYDSILKSNFLSGVQNPTWVRNAHARAFFMFQGTPYKLFEQRALQARRAGKDVKRAIGVTWEELQNFRDGLKRGEMEFKMGLIIDALSTEKDIFGQSVTKQFMKNVTTLGGIIWAGDRFFDADLHDHVFHPPFFKTDGTSPKLIMNPIVTAGYKAWNNRHKTDTDWLVLDFVNKWAGSSGPVPSAINKAIRLKANDIPDIYKQSPWKYMLSVPAAKE